MHPPHTYACTLTWTGNDGTGTASYTTYGRGYQIEVAGKPLFHGSADQIFKGDPALHNPEDLFLMAISACHLLTYLALAARHKVIVTGYRDEASGVLEFDGKGGGRFTSVTLRPTVTIAAGSDPELAMALHEDAHGKCFIAASCSVPIGHEARVEMA